MTYSVSIFKTHYVISNKHDVIKTHKLNKKKTENIGKTNKLI